MQRLLDSDSVSFRVVGGSGWPMHLDMLLSLIVGDEGIELLLEESAEEIFIPFEELTVLTIFGPGTVTTNGGFVGGGFGLEGAATGIFAAAFLNRLTKKSSTNTFLRIATREEEVFLHTSTIEPFDLRMLLSQAMVRMEATHLDKTGRREKSLPDEIHHLYTLMQSGALTEMEFSRAKAKLLA
jgi:cold shock CspA family protein